MCTEHQHLTNHEPRTTNTPNHHSSQCSNFCWKGHLSTIPILTLTFALWVKKYFGQTGSLQTIILWHVFFFSRIITAETHSVHEIPYVFLCVQTPLSRKIYFCVEHWKKVIRMTALIFTGDVIGDVEDKHQGLKWIPQLSTWWPFRFCECSNSLTWLLL